MEKEVSGNGDSETDYEELNDIILDLENELDEANVNLILYKKKYSDLKDNGYIRRKDQAYILNEKLLDEFLRYCPILQDEDATMVRRYSYKQMSQFGSWHVPYHYPEADGILKIMLDRTTYESGRTGALFIFGRTEEGDQVKFRFYYKRDHFFGRKIGFSLNSKIGSWWLCAFLVSQEGAADLIGALPLGSSWTHEDERRKKEYLRELEKDEEDDIKEFGEWDPEPMMEDGTLEDMSSNAVVDTLIEDGEKLQLKGDEKKTSLDDKLKDAKSRVKK